MVVERKRTPKTESLTIRLDPKTRFILDWVARLRGQTITTVVERAINEGASAIDLSSYDNRTWRDFWDVSEGVRALNIAAEPLLHPTYEEEERLAFVREHWPFFFTSDSKTVFRRVNLDILWPDIETYMKAHREGKASDYWHAGKMMKAALQAAHIASPDWPKEAVQNALSGSGRAQKRLELDDLDDEIPF